MITQIGKQLATQIVDTVHDVCGHDINFINKNGIIYASTNTSRIGSFHEIGKKAADTKTVIEVQDNYHYEGTSSGVNIPVAHNGYLIAVIGISGSPDEVRKFAYLAEKITRLLIREQELNAASRTLSEKRTYLVSYLLSGTGTSNGTCEFESFPDKIADLNYIHDLLDEFEINIEKKKRVLIIRMLSDHSTITISSAEEKILRMFTEHSIHLYKFQYPHEYAAIIDSSFPLKELESFCLSLSDSIQMGIGRPAELFKLSTSYDTARIALNSLTDSADHYALFDDLTLEILLGSLNEVTTAEFIAKTLSCLDEADCSLLRSYFDHEQSLSRTSEYLYLHKNTLQYKLDRIHKICGLNPRSFRDGVILYLALRLKEM